MRKVVIAVALVLWSVALVKAFAVKAQTGVVSATLAWVRPTQNVDGSALAQSAIAGYGIYYGSQSRFSSGTTLRGGCTAAPRSNSDTSCYQASQFVANGAAQTAVVTMPASPQGARIYFAVAAQAQSGVLSDYSNEATKQYVLEVPPRAPSSVTVQITVTCETSDPAVTCSFKVQ